MPISVKPSKQLDVDLSDAEDGELLYVRLKDHSTLILTARRYYSSSDPSLYIERQHMPLALREHIKNEVRRVLGGDLYGLRSWYEKQEDKSPGLYELIYAQLTSRCYVTHWEVGSVPVVFTSRFEGGNISFQPEKWEAPAAVTTLKEVDAWLGVVEEARIQAAM